MRCVRICHPRFLPAGTPAFVVRRRSHTAALTELAVDRHGSTETAHPFARVLVLRIIDGKKVWDGFADDEGRWKADGLQPGYEYVAVGIDPKREFKATAAGPVKASAEGA